MYNDPQFWRVVNLKTLNRINETNVILEMLEDKALKIEKGRSQLNADSIPKLNSIIDIRNNQENYINQIELLKHKIENNEYDGIENNFYKFRLSDHKAIISKRQSEKTLEESVVIQYKHSPHPIEPIQSYIEKKSTTRLFDAFYKRKGCRIYKKLIFD